MQLNEETKVQYGILAVMWLEFLWEFYLAIRQHRLCQKVTSVPAELKNVMTQETFDKARLYTLDKNSFSMIKDSISTVLSSIIIYCGFFHYFWVLADEWCPIYGEIAQSCMWLLILNTVSTLTGMPFNVYYTFILEEKYGFNKQTVGFFIKDKIKSFVLSQVLSVPISAFAIYIVQVGGDYFFVWLWLMVGIVVLILLTIYPAYIAPLFDKYTPLPEGELRTSIEALASELKFPLGQLYVVEGSKRSAHSNAYFYGLFGVKRIVLFDTLIAKPESGGCNNDEVLAVLAHELGHWKHGHVNKNLVIMQVNLFLMFAAFAMMFNYAPLYAALGFPAGVRPILIGLIAVVQFVMAPYNALLSFMLTMLSRYFEFQADEFAVKLGKAPYLIRALTQLNKDNLGFPVYDPLYSTWHLSHPPLLERISALTESDKKKQN